MSSCFTLLGGTDAPTSFASKMRGLTLFTGGLVLGGCFVHSSMSQSHLPYPSTSNPRYSTSDTYSDDGQPPVSSYTHEPIFRDSHNGIPRWGGSCNRSCKGPSGCSTSPVEEIDSFVIGSERSQKGKTLEEFSDFALWSVTG